MEAACYPFAISAVPLKEDSNFSVNALHPCMENVVTTSNFCTAKPFSPQPHTDLAPWIRALKNEVSIPPKTISDSLKRIMGNKHPRLMPI
jgi:hypothetical protein